MSSLHPARQILRSLLLGLSLLLLLPFCLLLTRISGDGGTILGRWSLGYASILVAYLMMWLLFTIFVMFAPSAFLDRVLGAIHWLRDRPILCITLAIAAEEGLWLLRPRLIEVFYETSPASVLLNNVLVYGRTTLFMQALSLILLYLALIIITAGRTIPEMRAALRRTGVTLAACLLGFIMAILVYALIIDGENYRAGHEEWAILAEPDDDLVYRHKANLRDLPLFFNQERGSFTVSTNASGFRGTAELDVSPIAVLGDSTIFGWGVSEGEVWSDTLRAELDVPAANYGVPGYYWWQYNRVAEKYAVHANHQIVIYAINATDMTDDSDFSGSIDVIRFWQMWPFQNPVNYGLNRFTEHSLATRLIRSLRRPGVLFPADELEEAADGCERLPRPLYLPQQELVVQHADHAIATARKGGYRVVFAMMPGDSTVYGTPSIPDCDYGPGGEIITESAALKFLCDYVQQQGALCYDMSSDLRASVQNVPVEAFYLPDSHWTPTGHAIIGHLLAQYIQHHQLLKD